VVVSLTTFGLRINEAALAIESIGRGAVRPRQIILWLDEGFRDRPLPRSIRRLMDRGLEIEFVQDIRSHKKYFFALAPCIASNLPLITIDDDFIYPPWFLERLMTRVSKEPDAVISYRAREIAFEPTGDFVPYDSWSFATTLTPQTLVFFTSGGGSYLPVKYLEALRDAGDGFLETCPLADDIWLNYHAARLGLSKRLVLGTSTEFTPLGLADEETLWSQNAGGGNDAQLRATFDNATIEEMRKIT